MRTRRWSISLLLAGLAVGCGDQMTEVVPEREAGPGALQLPGGVALATSSTEDGLSITTDKDDYQPGDTVHFTGAGWPANDVLDILLEDEPATHPPHEWTVDVGPDGTFRDSTYVVDVGDLGVTFTLTATSRRTGRSLTVVFTDNIVAISIKLNNTSVPPALVVAPNAPITLAITGNVRSGGPAPNSWNSTGWVVQTSTTAPTGKLANCVDTDNQVGGSGGGTETTRTINFNAPGTAGTYHIFVALSDVDGTGSTACGGGGGVERQGFNNVLTVQAPSGPAATTTEVVSSKNASVSGESVTFTATVKSGSPAAAIGANGAVSFRRGGTDCTTGTEVQLATNLDANGQAAYTASFNASESPVTIRACYGGTSAFAASNGAVVQNVNKAETSVTLTKSPTGNSVFSQPVTFYVAVSVDAPGSGSPSGDVTFEKGGTACGTGTDLLATKTLNASSQASFTTSALAVGTHTIRACYAGDLDFNASDNTISHTVDKAPTTTAITSSANPSILNQPVTFDVTVTADAPATATPDGNVTLKEGACSGGTTIGSSTALDEDGKASFTISNLAVGSHTIRACYAGTGSFESSNGYLTQYVQYNFDGLYAPVDRPNTMNVSKAGQGIPLKWRLTDYYGAPVLNFAPEAFGVAVSSLTCDVASVLDQIENYAGNSGLQNLGDGYYQFNWKTPSNYANSCRQIGLDLGEGSKRGPLAYFMFKK